MSDDAASFAIAPKAAPATFARSLRRYVLEKPLHAVAFAALAITALRVALLAVTEANLGPDEAQYWVWSKSLDWGYFSKPPLIAWIIAATTSVFGQSEWAVRLAAPLFHAGAAFALAALARRLFGPVEAFWSGVIWLTLPGVTLSSLIITTDAPLLFFWCVALYLFFVASDVHVALRRRLAFAAALGAAIGLGLLAKYAMVYFVLSAGLALLVSNELRRGWKPLGLAIVGLTALAVIAPNLAWNARHDFQTLSHTAANANWRDAGLNFDEALAFLAAQAGVFGPLPLIVFIWGLLTAAKRLTGPYRCRDAALLAFALPSLVIVTTQAFISRAHANWAAAAYPAATIVVVAWAFRANAGAVIKASARIHVVAGMLFTTALAAFPLIDAVGASSAVKRVRGWNEQGAAIAQAAQGYDAILVDDRELMASLLYYARGGPKVVSWNSNGAVETHFEAFVAFNADTDNRALFVTKYSDPRGVEGAFETLQAKGAVSVDVGPSKARTLYLFEVAGPKR